MTVRTALGLGRHIPCIKRAVGQIGLNSIVATGLYTFEVLPMLPAQGVTDDQIHQMLVGNPRRNFEPQGAY